MCTSFCTELLNDSFGTTIKKIVYEQQRPNVSELLRHRFVARARKTHHLVEIVNRYKRWVKKHPDDEDSDSDNSLLVSLV